MDGFNKKSFVKKVNMDPQNFLLIWIGILTILLLLVIGILIGLIRQQTKISLMTIVLRRLYKNYSTKLWALMSKIDPPPAVLNVAFPDKRIVYYVQSLHSKDEPLLIGKMPPNIYFWSLTVYDETGAPVNSVNDASFSYDNFRVKLKRDGQNKLTESGDYEMKIPEKGVYCIIERIYKSQTTGDTNLFLPEITEINKNLEPVTNEERIKNSLSIQNLLYQAFQKKIGNQSPSEMFPGVDTNKFFLPSKKQVDFAFPNPYAIYLMMFPTSSDVIKVTGKLPNASRMNRNGIRFVSFMASNMINSATEDSISMEDIKMDNQGNYTLYVVFSQKQASENNYNPDKDNLLLWSETNPYPVLIYRLVSTEDPKTGVFAIENENYSVPDSKLRDVMGDQYPNGICL